jgi:hypothetical protein
MAVFKDVREGKEPAVCNRKGNAAVERNQEEQNE